MSAAPEAGDVIARFGKTVVFQVVSRHRIQVADEGQPDVIGCRQNQQVVAVIIDGLAHDSQPVAFQVAVEKLQKLLFLSRRAVDIDEAAQQLPQALGLDGEGRITHRLEATAWGASGRCFSFL